MRKIVLLAAPFAACLSPVAFTHDEPAPAPEGHAPAGVMYDHMHSEGEWMIGYRYMRMAHGGLYYGDDEVNASDLHMAGFSGIPLDMSMSMHMFDIMYAPTDRLNLMLMPQYVSMDMEMNMMGGNHGGHGVHAMTGLHEHGTSGMGDTVLAALFRIVQRDGHQLHAGLGISAPTGSVDEKNVDGTFVHYGMQPGLGTWDVVPTLTYTGKEDVLSWGSQVGGTIHLENANDSGFSLGNRYHATWWGAWRAADRVSLSLRLQYTAQDAIDGHYNGPHPHSSPSDFQENYGGEFWDAGIGVNAVIAGQRIGVEWMQPLSEDYNGYQLGHDGTLNFSWSMAF